MPRRLILFDVDGTLIATNYAGRQVMSHALTEVYGHDGALGRTSFAGKTDLGIITEAMAASGMPNADVTAGLPLVYKAMARYGQEAFVRDGLIPCPGILNLMVLLQDRIDVALGLLTGNIRATAHLKLRAAGIDQDWFQVGAFGADSADRKGLLPVAWRRMLRLTGESFSGHNTLVVGDTPGDIVSARANGASVLAVASGFSRASELAEQQPDHLLADLADTANVLSILIGES